ncbi:MAG: TAXI family TRAP transporter solute-binding subunit [Pseudomonadota bacterium]|nr:TAXI family TRAP transporter solute-binding subunit [Pseudomonadota bacterium]
MRKMAEILARWSAGIVFGGLITASASAESVRIGAMPVGSGWYVAAAALEKTLEKAVEGLDIQIIARGGGVANPMVVQQGKADVALSNVATSQWAAKGQLIYEGQEAPDIRSLVGGLNPVFIGAIVRNEYLKKNGFSSLKDILESGKPVNILMKPPGSNIPPAVDVILKAHGTSKEKIEASGGRIIQVDSSQMASLMRDGRADILFDTVLRGHPTIQEIALTADVSFIDLSPEATAALSEFGVQKDEIPKWFDIQSKPTVGGDFGTHLIAHKDLPEETAYKITKAVVENMEQVAAEFPAWKAFEMEKAASPEKNGIPLHPGAERYYKEKGLL